MTPRRLLSIGHSYVVGANRRLAHAIQQVAGGRWEVEVAAPAYFHGGNDLRPVAFSPVQDEPCPVTSIPAYLTRRVHLFAYNWGRLRKVLCRKWDVIHAWEEPYILAGAELAACAPRNSCYVFRTAQSLNKRYPPPFNLFERYVLNRSAGWICSGGLVEANLKQRPRYANLPMARIPLGVDCRMFQPDGAAGASTRRALGWTESGPPVIGYLGRFVAEKGLGLLMKALDDLKSPWRALLVGGGKLEGDLRTWAAKYCDDRVRICTDVSHDAVPPYLNAMDILVAPSQTAPNWKEQFGRMLIEAMACGLTVVGSDSGEIPYVIGNAGVVLPEADVAAWTAALGELLENPSRAAELGIRGRDKACREFDWPVVARMHLEFFERILDVRP